MTNARSCVAGDLPTGPGRCGDNVRGAPCAVRLVEDEYLIRAGTVRVVGGGAVAPGGRAVAWRCAGNQGDYREPVLAQGVDGRDLPRVPRRLSAGWPDKGPRT